VNRVADAQRRYFEDVEVGEEVETPALTVTEAHQSLYDGLTGELRDHGGGAASPLLTIGLSSGLGWRLPSPPLVILAFMGLEWRFLAPVKIGDTIRCRFRTTAKRSMRDGGVIIEERLILNHRDEVVQSGKATLLLAKRPAS
jgi:acyl dehydratase